MPLQLGVCLEQDDASAKLGSGFDIRSPHTTYLGKSFQIQ
jgi:hypothetical protein